MDHVQVMKGFHALHDAVQDVRTKILAIVTASFLDDVGDSLLDKLSDDEVSAFEVEGLHVGDTVLTLDVCERENFILQMQKLLIVKCLCLDGFECKELVVRFSLSSVDIRLQLAFDGVEFRGILLFNEPELCEDFPQVGLTSEGL